VTSFHETIWYPSASKRGLAFESDRVSFRWRDYAHGGKKKIMTVSFPDQAALTATAGPGEFT
jgi:hypothetical protein